MAAPWRVLLCMAMLMCLQTMSAAETFQEAFGSAADDGCVMASEWYAQMGNSLTENGPMAWADLAAIDGVSQCDPTVACSCVIPDTTGVPAFLMEAVKNVQITTNDNCCGVTETDWNVHNGVISVNSLSTELPPGMCAAGYALDRCPNLARNCNGCQACSISTWTGYLSAPVEINDGDLTTFTPGEWDGVLSVRLSLPWWTGQQIVKSIRIHHCTEEQCTDPFGLGSRNCVVMLLGMGNVQLYLSQAKAPVNGVTEYIIPNDGVSAEKFEFYCYEDGNTYSRGIPEIELLGPTPQCQLCNAAQRKYYPFSGPQVGCLTCPSNHIGVPPEAPTACECAPGYAGADGVCTACAVGSYKETSGDGACVACLAGETTLTAGSKTNWECVCAAGSGLNTNNVCAACPVNEFKPYAGDSACLVCTDHDAKSVAPEAGSLHCKCKTGHFLDAGTGLCTPCHFATYKPVTGNGTCTQCLVHKNTSAVGAYHEDQCECLPGFTSAADLGISECTACPTGTYQPLQGNAEPCKDCGTGGTTTDMGETTDADCIPEAGYYMLGVDTFLHCPDNTYRAFVISSDPADYALNSCSACPARASSPPGSTQLAACTCAGPAHVPATGVACVCAAEYYLFDGVCEECPADSFCDGSEGGGHVQACLALEEAPAGSSSADACVCVAGAVRDAGSGVCQLCPAGTFESSDACAESGAATNLALFKPSSNFAGTPSELVPYNENGVLYGQLNNGVKDSLQWYDSATFYWWVSLESMYEINKIVFQQIYYDGINTCNTEFWLGNSTDFSSAVRAKDEEDRDVVIGEGRGYLFSCEHFAVGGNSEEMIEMFLKPGQRARYVFVKGYRNPTRSYWRAYEVEVYSFPCCRSCAAGTTSAAGAVSAAHCTAVEGYYKLPDGTVLACPENATSPAGATALAECKCAAGYTGADSAACAPCDAGTHKDYAGCFVDGGWTELPLAPPADVLAGSTNDRSWYQTSVEQSSEFGFYQQINPNVITQWNAHYLQDGGLVVHIHTTIPSTPGVLFNYGRRPRIFIAVLCFDIMPDTSAASWDACARKALIFQHGYTGTNYGYFRNMAVMPLEQFDLDSTVYALTIKIAGVRGKAYPFCAYVDGTAPAQVYTMAYQSFSSAYWNNGYPSYSPMSTSNCNEQSEQYLVAFNSGAGGLDEASSNMPGIFMSDISTQENSNSLPSYLIQNTFGNPTQDTTWPGTVYGPARLVFLYRITPWSTSYFGVPVTNPTCAPAGDTQCTPCAANMTTAAGAATSADACTCAPGYTDPECVTGPTHPAIDADTDNLIIWYKFDGNLTDSSENGNDAVAYNSPTFTDTAEKEGLDSIQFAGGAANSNAPYLYVPAMDFGQWDGFTVSCWVMFEETSTQGFVRIIDFGDGKDTTNIIICRYGTTNQLYIHVGYGTLQSPASKNAVSVNNVIANHNWIHVAWTIEKTPALWKLYVNGIQQDLTSTDFIFPQSATYTNNYIGKSNWDGGDAYFKGKMDDFRVYDKALSQTEITDVAVMYNLPPLLCGPDGCYACPVNTYKSSLGPEPCDACGNEQLAPGASTSADACACPAGQHFNGDECVGCGTGTYRAGGDDSACTACAGGMTTISTGGTSASACVCPPGETPSGDVCVPCATGTYKSSAGNLSCTALNTGEVTTLDGAQWGGAGATGFTCAAGHHFDNGVSCLLCAAGRYKADAGSGSCTACAVYTESLPDRTACVCIAGYVPNGTTCSPCEVNSYAAAGATTCTACPLRSFAPAASTDISQCLCGTGYAAQYDVSGSGSAARRRRLLTESQVVSQTFTCVPCAAGTFKDVVANTLCSQCPASAWSNVAAVECWCVAGFTPELVTVAVNPTHNSKQATAEYPIFLPYFNGGRAVHMTRTFVLSLLAQYYPDIDSVVCNSPVDNPPCKLSEQVDNYAIEYSEVDNPSLQFNHKVTTSGVPQTGGVLARLYPNAWAPTTEFMFAPIAADNPYTHGSYQYDVAQQGGKVFIFLTGSNDCEACPADTYKTENGSATCTPCPEFSSHTLTGSDTGADCVCDGGYSGDLATGCTACPAGSYLPVDTNECVACPAGTVASGATSAINIDEACLCAPGTTGLVSTGCSACLANSFQPAAGATTCESCPEFSTSPEAATSADNCTCDAEYVRSTAPTLTCELGCPAGFSAGPADLECFACTAGTYKPTSGSGACLACPEHSTHSLPNASSVDECLCAQGFVRAPSWPEPAACDACEAGTFNNRVNSTVCHHCYAEDASNVCTPDATQNSTACVGVCQVPAGQGAIAVFGDVLSNLAPCEPDTWNDGSDVLCQPCPAATTHNTTGATSVAACECAPGNALSASPPTTFVVTGTGSGPVLTVDSTVSFAVGSTAVVDWKATADSHPFALCTTASSPCVLPSSDLVTQVRDFSPGEKTTTITVHSIPDVPLYYMCYYGHGFVGVQVEVVAAPSCEACAPGTYKPDAGSDTACVPCPSGATSLAGASSAEQCVCAAGYGTEGSDASACALCAEGTQKFVESNEPCIACPADSTLLADSTHTSESCVCEAGFTGNAGSCTPCAPGTYKAEAGSAACTACGEFFTSPEGATTAAACVCDEPVYIADPQDPLACVASCNPGQFLDADLSCEYCAEGTYSDTLGSDTCTPCPEPHTRGPAGGSNVSDCVCPVGAAPLNAAAMYSVDSLGAYTGSAGTDYDALPVTLDLASAPLHSLVFTGDDPYIISLERHGAALALLECESACAGTVLFDANTHRLSGTLRISSRVGPTALTGTLTVNQYTKRAVSTTPALPNLLLADAETWAAGTGARSGAVLFDSTLPLSSDEDCVTCPASMVCAGADPPDPPNPHAIIDPLCGSEYEGFVLRGYSHTFGGTLRYRYFKPTRSSFTKGVDYLEFRSYSTEFINAAGGDNFEKCANICSDNFDCRAFSFDGWTNFCYAIVRDLQAYEDNAGGDETSAWQSTGTQPARDRTYFRCI